ncbi:MAG: aminoglycoside phosphotransferase family protein [Bacillota bacterium]
MLNIPGHSFLSIEPLTRGSSTDKKYSVQTSSGERLLLRVADISEYEQKKREFEVVTAVSRLGIITSSPIDFGICADGKSVYSLLAWIDGEEARDALLRLEEADQYALGVKAGGILKKIHSIPAPTTGIQDWGVRFRRKAESKIDKYMECPLKFSGDDLVIRYIRENEHLLDRRPQCFQHGDYHVGNMIITPAGELGIIDFNRFDYGDPWEEFNRIVWCANVSPRFASGRIDGYFGSEAPEEFFRLLALYIASNTLSSIYWAIPFGQAEIDTMMKQAAEVLDFYDGMKNPVPKWYAGVSR